MERHAHPLRLSVAVLGMVLGFAACDPRPAPLAFAEPGSGPVVRYDLTARPLPDIPFPNDVATRLDPTSPTGRRLNVSLVASTRLERDVREHINRLDGFGTFAPITVAFDAPLDVGDILARHRGHDRSDDAVFVVDITEGSETFGQAVPLDLGRGFFPPTLPEHTHYYDGDPRGDAISNVFETVEEDLDGDGLLDPGEDTDQDGVLDTPNVWPPGVPVEDGLLSFYERETDTLIIRPIRPLRERTRYAVVLTRRLVGLDGAPVQSPFEGINPVGQTEALQALGPIFEGWASGSQAVAVDAPSGPELHIEDVAFAWTFTTQSVTAEMVAIREGLYGEGPLAQLADVTPDPVPAAAAESGAGGPGPAASSPLVLDGDTLRLLVTLAFSELFDLTEAQVAGLDADLGTVAYAAQGWFTSPDLLTSDAPVFEQTMHIDLAGGDVRHTPTALPYLLVVPKETERHQQPFPVALYGHGFGQARIEPLAFAATLARYGIASVGIDAWGHGVNLSAADTELLMALGETLGIRPFLDTMVQGRAKDVDGTGRVNAGADMFSAYTFHTRDTVRQTAIDHLQLVRMLRGFDGQAGWADATPGLAGDFDQDGVVDAGGPDLPYFMWGSSMGGLLTGLVAPLEPAIIAGAPVAGGGGLSGFGRRSRQESVINNTVMGVVSPLLVARPGVAGGPSQLWYLYPQANKLREVLVAEVEIRPGDTVALINEAKGTRVPGQVLADGTIALRMQADLGDPFRVEISRADRLTHRIDTWAEDLHLRLDEPPLYPAGSKLRTPNEGLAYGRATPSLRRLVGLAQMGLESADPINYARHFFEAPLDVSPEGPTSTDLLVIATLGDPMNPSDVHVHMATAAGIFDLDAPDPRYGVPAADWLIDNWVLEGVCGYGRFPPNEDGVEVLFDPDALDRTLGSGDQANGFNSPRPPVGDELRATVTTPSGISGMRFAHMRPCGKHSFFLTDPSNPFNVDEYLQSLVGVYFATHAQLLLDDGCHETSSCEVP